ncbi:MAG TPA: SRPBCC family protein [Candidatus Angelobacter sp.]|jgi:uncharacterized membrane protein|nr:SRPBCC family protein [Candidatus Angelobacter sp.]
MRFASGLLIGGGLMYLLDPDKSGKRRRILARDKAVRAEHVFGRFADKTVRDMENRVQGMVAWVRASIHEREVPDEILEQRVRASIGRAVSHPHAIKVEAHEGIVRLYGPILQNEIESLLATVRSVRDARAVENCLEPHEIPDGVPDLQGKSGRRGRRIENWPPSVRALVGLAGIGLLSASRRYSRSRKPLAIAGSAALFRAVTNMSFRRALGFSRTPRVIIFQKTVNLNAPLEEIYGLFANPENFPQIFEHVEDVRHSRDNLYHWTVRGPGGMSVSWESMLTENIPNEVIAWRSMPDATVTNAGLAKFQRNADGGTAVHIQFAYNPPAGVIGHAIASLFGADPKHALDDDMARLKSLFENGKTTVHHRRITKEEVEERIKSNEEPCDTGHRTFWDPQDARKVS